MSEIKVSTLVPLETFGRDACLAWARGSFLPGGLKSEVPRKREDAGRWTHRAWAAWNQNHTQNRPICESWCAGKVFFRIRSVLPEKKQQGEFTKNGVFREVGGFCELSLLKQTIPGKTLRILKKNARFSRIGLRISLL